MRVLLLRPPRYVWPFNSETSAFWQPLGLLCLAGAVRESFGGDVEIEVWDAPGEKMGWQTLARRLGERRIDVLGVGDEAVSAHEALRAAGLVKDLWPDCTVVAGGVYFAYAIEKSLKTGLIDVIVRGEGERTFVEWLKKIDTPNQWSDIEGLAFLDQGEVCLTPMRRLVDDMDSLPTPAYDLIDMANYGRNSHNHPNLVSIEHSRGCTDNCGFCILWKHFGQTINGNGEFRSCWRTKSPQRSFDEVEYLYKRFGRRTFGWVDPTFNAFPDWSDQWAELMLGSDMVGAGGPKTVHTAWLRADGVVRDEKLGVLEKLVRAGLRQVMIGIERDDQGGLSQLNKHNNNAEICREAFDIFRRRYPQVYTIGTMIYGLPGDTLQSIKRLTNAQYKIGADYCFIMPLTPNPGTATTRELTQKGYVENKDLASYNFHTPVCRTDTMNLRQLENVYWKIMLNPTKERFKRGVRMLFEPDRRKRQIYRSLLGKGTQIALTSLVRALFNPKDKQPSLYSRRPLWYNK
ncbi:MAG: B12-binding domain-containing radical SAM protein [Phycisphaerae bacterium]|nr:B12-binding domain-containing radical SAM protein [Phycisphaerae bacterium]